MNTMTCPVCQTKQAVREDPDYPADLGAMGSNAAGLRIEPHKTPSGEDCKGSGHLFR
jgi:hypothetical protein